MFFNFRPKSNKFESGFTTSSLFMGFRKLRDKNLSFFTSDCDQNEVDRRKNIV